MKINYLVRGILAVIILTSFSRCSKKTVAIETDKSLSADTIPSVAATNTLVASDQSPDGTFLVRPTFWRVDGTNIAPGSIIYISRGNRGALLLQNVKGTPDKPIIIVNKDGQVTFTADLSAGYAFKTINCQYFKVLGNGVPKFKYGLVINGGNIGMTIDELSSDFEIQNVEVRNSGFAGIMAKTDPTCDVKTQRGHFTMQNVLFHDNYVHKTGGEGFYIGNSFYADGISTSCGTVLPHDVINARVYNNITDSTGCEGIQVGGAIKGCEIYGNTITNPGLTPFANNQNNGIQIGEGTGGKCYNNLVKNSPGNGIIVLGLGDNLVFNNIVLNSGDNGIFADSRYTPGPNFQFINNTIVGTKNEGIKLDSELIPMNTIINNAIINAGSGNAILRISQSVKLLSSNNYISTDINSCKFVDFQNGDYHLQSSSPLIGAGLDVSANGITFDFFQTLRPSGKPFDIGATEYK